MQSRTFGTSLAAMLVPAMYLPFDNPPPVCQYATQTDALHLITTYSNWHASSTEQTHNSYCRTSAEKDLLLQLPLRSFIRLQHPRHVLAVACQLRFYPFVAVPHMYLFGREHRTEPPYSSDIIGLGH
jgi:hypothetical protein